MIRSKDHAAAAATATAAADAATGAAGSDAQAQAQAQAVAQEAQQAQQNAIAQVAASSTSTGNAGGGSTVMVFDENASPEEKARAALQASAGAKGLTPSQQARGGGAPKESLGTGMASDVGSSAHGVKTTLNLADIDRVSKLEGQLGGGRTAEGAVAAGTQQVAGVAPDAVVGWSGVSAENTRFLDPPLSRPAPPPGMAAPGEMSGDAKLAANGKATHAPAPAVNGKAAAAAAAAAGLPPVQKANGSGELAPLQGAGGLTAEELIEEQEARKAHFETELVSRYLSDSQLGYFWWNGAAMLLAVLATYFLTRFGAGLMGMLVVGAFATTYYNASMRRTRQRYRDDITRELSKKKMASEHESAEWINHFMCESSDQRKPGAMFNLADEFCVGLR